MYLKLSIFSPPPLPSWCLHTIGTGSCDTTLGLVCINIAVYYTNVIVKESLTTQAVLHCVQLCEERTLESCCEDCESTAGAG